MYVLNIDKETNRILSAYVKLPSGNYKGMPIIDTLPDGNITDYLYKNGEFVLDPLPIVEIIEKPTLFDLIDAQVTYTAIMTDTLLEV